MSDLPPEVANRDDSHFFRRFRRLQIAMAYAMLDKEEPVEAAAHILRGYTTVVTLSATERSVLPTLVACRVVCSVVLGAFSSSLDPENKYLLLTQVPNKPCAGTRAPLTPPPQQRSLNLRGCGHNDPIRTTRGGNERRKVCVQGSRSALCEHGLKAAVTARSHPRTHPP